MGDLYTFQLLYAETFGQIFPSNSSYDISSNYELLGIKVIHYLGYESVKLLDSAGVPVMIIIF